MDRLAVIWDVLREELRQPRRVWRARLPGLIGLGLLVFPVGLWTLWSVAEMFYEGWWGPWYLRLAYLIPAAICLLLTVIVLRWPRLGGLLIILAGVIFSLWWWPMQLRRGGGSMTLVAFVSVFMASGIFVITGGLLFWEGRRLARLCRDPAWRPPARWWVRHARWLAGLGIPIAISLNVLAVNLPVVLFRVDQGDRSAALIGGNGVTLLWAPEGPGWARGAGPFPGGVEPVARYPGWDTIALYGRYGLDAAARPADEHATAADMDALGLCAYLSADGTQLGDAPQGIWRLPTVDEIARSLVWRGENAGCAWDGTRHGITCARPSDKDWPLWAPDWSPVYYWAADEHSAEEAWYVSSTGSASYQPKTWGNSRHGFRCVRAPE